MQKWRPEYPVPLWHYVWLCAIMALTRFLILRKSWEEMVHFLLSRAGELNFHFSMFLIVKISKIKFLFSSQNSWFWRKFLFSNEWDFEENFSFSSRMNEILQTESISLLEIQKFWEKKIIFSSWFFPQFLFQFSLGRGSPWVLHGEFAGGGWRRWSRGDWRGFRVSTEEEK